MVVLCLCILLILTLSYKPPIKEGFDIGKEIKNSVLKPIQKETTKQFNKAKADTTKGFNAVKKGTDNIFKEIINIANYVMCGFDKIKTLPQCFFWYTLDIIYGVFYLFYSMLVFIIPPLKDIGKMLGKGVKIADKFIYKVAGFYLFRYPKNVIKKCYLCKKR